MDNKRLPIKKEQFETAVAQEAEILLISQIRQEYKKIDDDWLLMHYRISVGLVLFSLVIEFGIGYFLISSGLLTITADRYILEYMAAPACANAALIIITTTALRAKCLPQSVKFHIVSLVFLGICFVLATVHNKFSAIYFLFAIAVALTIIYANYCVTCMTGLAGIAAIIISELLIEWDPEKTGIFGNAEQFINFLIALFILAASSLVSVIQIRFEINKNEACIQKELERQLLHLRLRTDELTGVFSRKALHDIFREIDANPSEHDFIFAIVDLDKFKGVNDCLGHHTGDSYLVAFANILKDNNAKADVYRYGGDEFCLLFHNTPMETAVETCRQLRQKLSALTFEEYPTLRLTASFGLAAHADNITTARLFMNADEAMYKAKRQQDGICIFMAPGQYDAPGGN